MKHVFDQKSAQPKTYRNTYLADIARHLTIIHDVGEEEEEDDYECGFTITGHRSSYRQVPDKADAMDLDEAYMDRLFYQHDSQMYEME